MNFHLFSVCNTIEWLSYFSFKCNGTVLIAEIHQLIMSNIKNYRKMLTKSPSFYAFLVQVNKIIAPGKAVGSCTDPRATYWGGSSDIEWDNKTEELFSLIIEVRGS